MTLGLRKHRRPGNRGKTKAENTHIDAITRAGCVCCIAKGYPHDPDGQRVEAHHLLSGGIRIGHSATIGLCQWHHRARLIVNGWSHAMHRERLGPSLQEGSVPFRAAFGDDASLIEQQAALLAQKEAA